jgi:hypothetical protein
VLAETALVFAEAGFAFAEAALAFVEAAHTPGALKTPLSRQAR